jgi:hypothetical protein
VCGSGIFAFPALISCGSVAVRLYISRENQRNTAGEFHKLANLGYMCDMGLGGLSNAFSILVVRF